MTDRAGLESAIGHRFTNPDLLAQALRHRSAVGGSEDGASNERLEFLGDTVLQIVVTDFIFREYPHHSEGELAKLRAEVVSRRALHAVAEEFHLGEYLILDKGEETTGGRHKASILADAMEAVIGAVYLDGGLDVVGPVVMRSWEGRIRAEASAPGRLDYKSRLLVVLGSDADGIRYSLTSSGPDHDKLYTARVFLGQKRLGSGSGGSKRAAHQAAAREALSELGKRPS